MKIFKTVSAIALVASLAACGGTGDISETFGNASNIKPVKHGPPPGHVGQWWTDPSNQCSYSRAQAPGYSPTWHLILNPHHIGQPNAHSGCPVMLKPGYE